MIHRVIARRAWESRPLSLGQLVGIGAGEIEAVDLLQLDDLLPRLAPERRLPFEGVEHDSLQQVAQGDVVVFGQPLENLEQALLDANPGLHPLDPLLYHGTTVPLSQQAHQTRQALIQPAMRERRFAGLTRGARSRRGTEFHCYWEDGISLERLREANAFGVAGRTTMTPLIPFISCSVQTYR